MSFQQRTIVAVFHPFVNRLRICRQPYDLPCFLHLADIVFPHRRPSAAGNYYVFFILQFDQQTSLKISKILFSVRVKYFGNTHALSVRNLVVHFNFFHGIMFAQIIGNRGLAASHKSDKKNIIGKYMLCRLFHLFYPVPDSFHYFSVWPYERFLFAS